MTIGVYSESFLQRLQAGFDDDGWVPDAIFADSRLAELYDVVDDDRSDLDAYVAIVAELEARSVLDVGCGTGTLACRLALGGTEVVGLDPAEASLDVARRKAGADFVRWVHGAASDLPPFDVDLAVMTGNVAQVFITDEEWTRTLAAVRDALRPQGWLVFETRSDSTLRFRSHDEIIDCLKQADFAVREVRDAPDRPALEFVFLAQRS